MRKANSCAEWAAAWWTRSKWCRATGKASGRPDRGLRLPEIRIQVSPTRFRVADVAVWRSGPIGQRIPTVPPFLVVEILSPEDRLVRLQPKIREYLTHGVEWVWVIDPDDRRALSYSPADPGGALVDELRTQNPEITIPLAGLLSALD
ncbi:MAG: Uma2 family endonuclease [Acidobacteria bacterium]|nr:Uma2 family endonuclease [Acidobacteriota bacterium]